MMIRVVPLGALTVTRNMAEAFIRERGAQHDTYHRVYAPSEGLTLLSTNTEIWEAARRAVPYLIPEGSPHRFILVHVSW